jgi:hypothetical protein
MCWNGWAKAVSRSSTRVKQLTTETEEEQRKAFATELHGKARKKKESDLVRSCFTYSFSVSFRDLLLGFDRRLGTANET